MKRSRRQCSMNWLILLICLCIAPRLSYAAKNPLEAKISSPKNLLVGQRPMLQIEISNTSNKPVKFVRPLDGSLFHWRYPRISIQVCDQNDGVISFNLGGRCGNMNQIIPDHICQLKPGQTEAFSIGWPFSDVFNKPGSYKITVEYDLRAPDVEAWVIQGRPTDQEPNRKLAKQLKSIPKLLIISKPSTVTVHTITKEMINRMLLEYFDRKKQAFVKEDLNLGKWHLADIKQHHGYISCKVLYINSYEPPARPHYVTKGFWFPQGRYIFEPYHYVSNSDILLALPQDEKAAMFRLHVPKGAAIFAAKHMGIGKYLGFSSQDIHQEHVEILKKFLAHEKTDKEIFNQAKDIIHKTQVIFLNYQKDKPFKTDLEHTQQHKLVETLKRSNAFVTRTSRHEQDKIYPGLTITLSTFADEQIIPENWLEYMRLPILKGFDLKSVKLIYKPGPYTKKVTFGWCQSIVRRIIRQIDNLKLQFSQLRQFRQAKISDGKWEETTWPSYPFINYRYGFGAEIPGTKGSHEKTTENWCEIRVWFSPVDGFPQAVFVCGQEYPAQGVRACWSVNSADGNLNTMLKKIVKGAFEPLGSFENEVVIGK